MDDDVDAIVAELLGVSSPVLPARPDVTSQANLATLDERARELMEHTGVGYERCVVVLQNQQVVAHAVARMVEQLAIGVRQAFTALAQAIQPVMERLSQLAVDIEAAQAPVLDARRCPRHGEPLTKGGSCRRCQSGQGQWTRAAERRHQQLRRVRR